MREIIFRGKRTTNGEWVTGDLRQLNDPFASICTADSYHFVDCDTIGQYTGYNDATDTGVYKGDIVEFPFREYDKDGEVMSKKTHVGFVYFSFGQWSVRIPEINTSTNLYGIDSRKITVVGNIHDNPELVEEES